MKKEEGRKKKEEGGWKRKGERRRKNKEERRARNQTNEQGIIYKGNPCGIPTRQTPNIANLP